ncbi:MAG TPA: N-acetylmuramoyl-L-alanine amidase [Bacteroidetes bacterium]|nr:N-acetylmuramoyl-L-alanine amidase [Bacteroidota bacterium]
MNRYEPLFGKKWATVPIEDQSMAGRVFYIMSGHGGPDPGAQCTKCKPVLCEDEYAYDVALRLARDLMQHGAIVHVIVQDKNDGIRDEKYLKCDRDEVTINGLKIPLSQRKRLKQRSNDVNRLYNFYKKKRHVKSQTLVVIHVDSRHKDQRIDVFFSYAKGSKTGKKLAKNILKTFDKKYSIYQKGRGYNGTTGERNWFVLNNTLPPAVFIELANIKNPKDHKRLLIPSNRQALANWIFEGLRNTYK